MRTDPTMEQLFDCAPWFLAGDTVVITQGPWTGLPGLVTRVNGYDENRAERTYQVRVDGGAEATIAESCLERYDDYWRSAPHERYTA